jgi:hypothetical protein
MYHRQRCLMLPFFRPPLVGFPERNKVIHIPEPICHASGHRWTDAKCTVKFDEVEVAHYRKSNGTTTALSTCHNGNDSTGRLPLPTVPVVGYAASAANRSHRFRCSRSPHRNEMATLIAAIHSPVARLDAVDVAAVGSLAKRELRAAQVIDLDACNHSIESKRGPNRQRGFFILPAE